MNYSFSDLLSGVIGALIGSTATLVVGSLKARMDSKDKLRALLLGIGRRLYHDSKTFEILDSSYDLIVDACIEYQSRIFFFWNRAKFQRLWFSLVGHSPKSRARHCHSFPDQKAAINITEEILRFLGHGYPHEKK